MRPIDPALPTVFLFLWLSNPSQGQAVAGGRPARAELRPLDEVATIELPPFDLAALLKEDQERDEQCSGLRSGTAPTTLVR